MTTEQHQEILRTEGLSKFFPGVKALDNVDFSLRRGEIMALLGENGAGKSTLIKALTGVYHADRGTIWLEGNAISPKNTAHAQQLGIGTVYQEVNLLPICRSRITCLLAGSHDALACCAARRWKRGRQN